MRFITPPQEIPHPVSGIIVIGWKLPFGAEIDRTVDLVNGDKDWIRCDFIKEVGMEDFVYVRPALATTT